MDKTSRQIYMEQMEGSPSAKCREILNLTFKTPDYWHFIFYDDFENRLAGGCTLSTGNLTFLNDNENILHAIKIPQLFVANEYRGQGFFRVFCETLLDAADMSGTFIYLVARAYKLNMPTIQTPEAYLDWVDSEEHYMEMHKDSHYERNLSLNLKKAYRKFGFLPLKVDRKDCSKEFWTHQVLCNNPKNCCDDIKEALTDRIIYDEHKHKCETSGNRNKQSHRKRDKRKRQKKHKRNHKRCA